MQNAEFKDSLCDGSWVCRNHGVSQLNRFCEEAGDIDSVHAAKTSTLVGCGHAGFADTLQV